MSIQLILALNVINDHEFVRDLLRVKLLIFQLLNVRERETIKYACDSGMTLNCECERRRTDYYYYF